MQNVNNSTRTSILLDKKYWEFFIPTILMAMTLTMSVVVDSIIVGNLLGADALAAVNLVMPVVMAYNTVAACLGMGAAISISVAKGRRQDDYANTIFTVAFATMLFVSLIFLAAQAPWVDTIAGLLTREPTLRPLVQSYLHILIYGTPLIIAVPGLAYCLRVDGRVKLASAVLIVSNVVNLALDLVYMGPLEMGIAGSSLATVSGYAVGAVMLLAYAFSKSRTLRIMPGVLTRARELATHVREILATGSPAALGSVLITIKILCINHIVVAVAGKSGMVAFSVCISCLSFVSMFISGAAQAMNPIVGVLFGEADHTGVYFVVRRAFKTLLFASLSATLLLEAAPELVLELFGVQNPTDIVEGVHAIRIFSLSLVGTSISFLSMFYYMTTGRRTLSNAIAFVQGFSVVPFAFILSGIIGISGVWIAFSLAEIATISMVAFSYLRQKKRYPHQYDSPLLLNREQLPAGTILETTAMVGPAEIEKAISTVGAFLQENAIPTDQASTASTALRDAAATIKEKGCRATKKMFLDIRVIIHDGTLKLMLRDNGKTLNLENEESLTHVKESAESMEYACTIGFNNNTITYSVTQ